jgi:hypothetical protein
MPLVISSALLHFFIDLANLLRGVRAGVRISSRALLKSITAAPDIEEYLNFVLGMFYSASVWRSRHRLQSSPVRMRYHRGATARIPWVFLGGWQVVTALQSSRQMRAQSCCWRW